MNQFGTRKALEVGRLIKRWALTWRAILGIGLATVWLPATSSAQDDAVPPRKQATAVRVPDGAVRLDGRLEQELWSLAPVLTDFIQKEPIEGATPNDRIEIRFLYDGGALYVGAKMFSPSRDAIQAPLSRRDDGRQSEHLLISLDTYRDRRTAYTFGVTASGVRLDHYHPVDDENNLDREFDPVLGGTHPGHRFGLDGRNVDPVLATPLQCFTGAGLGPQHQAVDPLEK